MATDDVTSDDALPAESRAWGMHFTEAEFRRRIQELFDQGWTWDRPGYRGRDDRDRLIHPGRPGEVCCIDHSARGILLLSGPSVSTGGSPFPPFMQGINGGEGRTNR